MSDRPDDSGRDEGKSSSNIVKWILIAVGALAGVVVVALIIALIGGLSGSEGVAAAFRVLRDFFIIVLALQGILISVALMCLLYRTQGGKLVVLNLFYLPVVLAGFFLGQNGW